MRFPKVFLFTIFLTLACFAQDKNHNMVIHQTDGSEARYRTEIIDSITFEEREATNMFKPEKISVSKIYGDGSTYCAFTSLVKRNGTYYIAFREGKTHVAEGDYGVIRILKSTDGEIWDTAQILKVDNVDLRDPNLSVMPDSHLLLICGARILSERGDYITLTYGAIEIEGRFETPSVVNIPKEINNDTCSWIWRLTWNNGVAYGVCYGNEDPVLLKTIDGINYEFVSNLSIPGQPSECRIRFKDDGTAIMLVRRDQGNISGYMGKAKPPYTDWDWQELNIYIAGEDFIIDGNRIVLATRMIQNIGSWTALWFGDDMGNFCWCYTLPYGCVANRADTAYAGILNEIHELWISYYAIDEGTKPSVFLVKVPKNILVF